MIAMDGLGWLGLGFAAFYVLGASFFMWAAHQNDKRHGWDRDC